MKEVTVEILLKYCQDQIKKGNGKKKIVLAGDDEGNYGHVMYYGFTESIDQALLNSPVDRNEKADYVVLG